MFVLGHPTVGGNIEPKVIDSPIKMANPEPNIARKSLCRKAVSRSLVSSFVWLEFAGSKDIVSPSCCDRLFRFLCV